MTTGRKSMIAIALAACAVWWMQAKGYEKGRARIFAENDACVARLEKGDPEGRFLISNEKYCDLTYSPRQMDSVPERLYEYLVR
jgi:hypothetical protein